MAACSGERSSPKGARTATSTQRRRGDVPAPAALVRTSWSTDPWTLGSYSFLGVGAEPGLRADLARPVEDVLYLAGEHVARRNPAKSVRNRSPTNDLTSRPASLVDPSSSSSRVSATPTGAYGPPSSQLSTASYRSSARSWTWIRAPELASSSMTAALTWSLSSSASMA